MTRRLTVEPAQLDLPFGWSDCRNCVHAALEGSGPPRYEKGWPIIDVCFATARDTVIGIKGLEWCSHRNPLNNCGMYESKPEPAPKKRRWWRRLGSIFQWPEPRA